MFLKHGAKKVNEIELVAPTGRDRTCRIQVRDFIARRGRETDAASTGRVFSPATATRAGYETPIPEGLLARHVEAKSAPLPARA